MKGSIIALLIVVTLSAGCSGFLPLTRSDALKYNSAIDVSMTKHTGLTFIKPTKMEDADRFIAVIDDAGPSKRYIVDELTLYCDVKGGNLRNIEKERNERFNLLKRSGEYTYKAESEYFECGPEGSGTMSKDWTKFNPTVCRKIMMTTIDENKIREELKKEFGSSPDFACIRDNSVLFMFSFFSYYDRSVSKDKIVLRVNEGKTGALPISELQKMK